MAINPNTEFTAGQVLTADQTNRFPRGIVAFAQRTTNFTMSTTEAVSITASTFTAVANRYYKITYRESAVTVTAGAGNFIFQRIRLTNATGTQLLQPQLQSSGATQVANVANAIWVGTLTAGSTVIVGTLVANTGTPAAFAGASNPAQIIVEDLGPA
jgi:hypothetical protein